jgi:hypothetical protein
VSDSKFDKFQHPLFKSKSKTDLKELITDRQELNKLIPKSYSNFSKEHKYQSWDSPTKEVKRKFDYSEQSKQSNLLDFLVKKEAQKLSRKSQLVKYIVDLVVVPSKQAPITTSQSVSAMANRYAPLVLPANLNAMPTDYSTKIKQFGDDEAYTARQHVQWFKDFCDLLEVVDDDVKMRLFAQSLKEDVKNWFRGLYAGSIPDIDRFHAIFLEKWEEKKNYV